VSPSSEESRPVEKPRLRWSWGRRLGFGVLTLVLLAGMGECGLRVAGAIWRPDVDESAGVDDCDAVVFLAIGDSMTFGMGAERHEAYPRRFVELFEKAHPGLKAKVYNLGVPGSNTYEGLDRTREFLASNPQARPDFALAMIGINNRWNLHQASFWDFDDSAKRQHLARYIASSFQLGKAASVALQGGEAAQARLRNDYKTIHDEKGWSVFFDSFEDDLLRRWIAQDYGEIDTLVRSRGTTLVQLTYFEPRFDDLNPLLRRIADEAGRPLIDLERPESYYRLNRYHSPDNFHLNAKGYRDAARRLLERFGELYDREDLERLLRAKRAAVECRR
jgi:lysophospholipase L1-like esterase